MRKRGISKAIIVFLVILILFIAISLFYIGKLAGQKKVVGESDCDSEKDSDGCYYSLAQNGQLGLCAKIQDSELKTKCELELAKYSPFEAP